MSVLCCSPPPTQSSTSVFFSHGGSPRHQLLHVPPNVLFWPPCSNFPLFLPILSKHQIPSNVTFFVLCRSPPPTQCPLGIVAGLPAHLNFRVCRPYRPSHKTFFIIQVPPNKSQRTRPSAMAYVVCTRGRPKRGVIFCQV